MIKFVTIVGLLISFLAIGAGQSTGERGTKLKLSYVPDADFGCGCYLSQNKVDDQNRRYLFVSPMEEAASINLNGNLIKLRRVAESKPRRHERIGDRSWERYAGDGVTVRVSYIVTRICHPNDENCESTDYKTRLTVRRGKQVTALNGFGVCGC